MNNLNWFHLSFNLNRNNIQDKKYTGKKADPFVNIFQEKKKIG